MKQKIKRGRRVKVQRQQWIGKNVQTICHYIIKLTDYFCVFTGPMWSWRLALVYWWLFFCFTSSSPVATHPKRSYSLVINPAMCISQLTCWCISQYPDYMLRLIAAMHCSRANSDIHKKLYRILLSPCQNENRNVFACDFTWYVKSCLDWLGSEQSSARLF